ncbi:MAG: 30S ribosomal protein S1 [Armatimonadetes bacterium]|nr:30S ribosomal protein S1 [Armatimonadota bacterium]
MSDDQPRPVEPGSEAGGEAAFSAGAEEKPSSTQVETGGATSAERVGAPDPHAEAPPPAVHVPSGTEGPVPPADDAEAATGPKPIKPAGPGASQQETRPKKKGSGMDDSAEFEAALNAFSGEVTGTAYDSTFRPLSKGELLTATVIQVDKDKAFVDLGTKAEGVIPLDELSSGLVESASDVVKVGDEIKVVVIEARGREGNPIVSKKRADFEEAWDRILRAHEQKETLQALVTERVRGGLEVDVGVRGFVPASHVGSGRLRNLDRFVGQSLHLKVIDVDRERRKVVLSNRLAEQGLREQRKREIFETAKPGDVLEGTVRRLVDYGAFVDLGGVDGLLHVSELSWSRVEHPKEVIREGERIKVMVLRLDPAKGRISLGRRQVLPDPWVAIRDNYSVAQRLTVPISRLVQAGAFVKLPEGAEAFIPVSEMAHRRIGKPSDVVSAGDEVEVQIIELRPDERRMVLSMRAVLPFEEREPRQGEGRRRRGRERTHVGEAEVARGATIGERLGALKGLIAATEEEAEESAGEQPQEPKAEVEAEKSEKSEEKPADDAEGVPAESKGEE